MQNTIYRKNNDYKHSENGLNIIKEYHKNQAVESGKYPNKRYDLNSPIEIYKALNNYILDGMSCYNVNNITINEDKKLKGQIFKSYWQSANGSLDTLYELRKLCMPSFISSGNADFCYIFNADYINDSRAFTYQILKAS